MGLKPDCLLILDNLFVMEHDYRINSESVMRLKEDRLSCPNGSPLLCHSSKSHMNSNGDRPIVQNGFRTEETETHLHSSIPLRVEVNGFQESPITSPLENGSLLASCSSLNSYSEHNHFMYPSASSEPGPSVSQTNSRSSELSLPFYRSEMTPGTLSPSSLTRKEVEMNKKRLLAEKIARCKDRNSLTYLVPQCEQLTAIQLASMARKVKDGLPPFIRKYVFEDEPSRKFQKTYHRQDDEDLTDLSDLETEAVERVDYWHGRWCEHKVRLGCQETKLNIKLEEKYEQLKELQSQLDALQQRELDDLVFEKVEDTCARARPLVRRKRRNLLRHSHRDISDFTVDYASMQPSTSKEQFTLPPSSKRGAPVERRMQSYVHWLSLVPSATVRKRADKLIWHNSREMKEEKQRNGWNRFAKREQRRLREEARERLGSDSSDYEDTDESDDEYEPKAFEYSRHDRHHSQRRKERSIRREGFDHEPLSPYSRFGRRHSLFNSVRVHKIYDVEECMPDLGIAHLPPKVDYKEIVIPTWLSEDGKPQTSPPDESPIMCSFCEYDLVESLTQIHDFEEEEERRRFKAFREQQAAREQAERELAGIGSDPSSGQNTPVSSYASFFETFRFPPDPEDPKWTQKTSSAEPYSPRQYE